MKTSPMPAAIKRLVTTSFIYMLVAIVAGAVAISRNLPAQPMGEGSGTGRPVLQEFLIGNGTAMSPGLPWLAVQVLLTLLAVRGDRWGTISVALLGFHALLSGIFATTEPIFRKIFSPATFDPLLAVVETCIVVLPFLIVALAGLELQRRLRARSGR